MTYEQYKSLQRNQELGGTFEATDICRSSEITGQLMAGMSQHEQSYAVKGTSSSRSHDTGNDSWQRSKNSTRNDHDSKAKACKFCGTTHADRNCPAYGKSCNKCGMCNHFAQCCSNFVKAKQTQKKTPVHTVQPDSNNHADGNMFVCTVLNSRN